MRSVLCRDFAAPFALALAILGLSSQANAGFQVTLTAGPSSITIVDGGAFDDDGMINNEIDVDIVVGEFRFQSLLAVTNSTGTPTLAFVDAGTNRITKLTGTGNDPNSVISIYASANNFNTPTAPPALSALTSATIQFLSGNTSGDDADPVSVTAYVDNLNGLSTTGTGAVIGSNSGAIEAGGMNDNINLNDMQSIASLSPNYSLNLLLSANLVQGRAGTVIDLDGGVELRNVVPEPTTLAAAFTALPLIGGLYLRRRRMQRMA